MVRGEFIVPMSGDDILLPTKLEKQVAYLQENTNCGLVLSVTQAFDTNTKEILYTLKPAKKPQDWLLNTDFLFRGKKYGSHNNTTTMGRSTYYLANKYDTRLKYKGEVLHAIENYAKAPTIKWHGINEVLSLYRIHKESATHSANLTNLIEEESWIIHGIICVRHPQLYRKSKNTIQYRLFRLSIFNKDFKFKQTDLLRELGCIKYLYLIVIKMLSAINMRGIISKPSQIIKKHQIKFQYEHIK